MEALLGDVKGMNKRQVRNKKGCHSAYSGFVLILIVFKIFI